MEIVFYLAAFVAVITTALAITRLNAVHALLYVIVSLLSVALIFYTLGAPFVAALEVIIYAGAIMVLFIFVVMMLNLGPQTIEQERMWFDPKAWRGPAILALILLAELIYVITQAPAGATGRQIVEPQQISFSLFGPYLLGVELASFLLLAGLVGAHHTGRQD
jgi:NADH-quinone oxidoreductase subunit J